jgi:hypothetical protein
VSIASKPPGVNHEASRDPAGSERSIVRIAR